MAQPDLYDRFLQLADQLQQAENAATAMKDDIAAALEKNAELQIENQHLRERLSELEQNAPAASSKAADSGELSKSKQNLQNLYEEGYHVCPYMYGQRRIDNEACAFCLDVIYGEH